jgi:hypothetical protein
MQCDIPDEILEQKKVHRGTSGIVQVKSTVQLVIMCIL